MSVTLTLSLCLFLSLTFSLSSQPSKPESASTNWVQFWVRDPTAHFMFQLLLLTPCSVHLSLPVTSLFLSLFLPTLSLFLRLSLTHSLCPALSLPVTSHFLSFSVSLNFSLSLCVSLTFSLCLTLSLFSLFLPHTCPLSFFLFVLHCLFMTSTWMLRVNLYLFLFIYAF